MAFLSSYFSGDVNETHGLPLNVRPYSAPHIYQHGFRDYKISDSHGDYRISFLGRDGFKKCVETDGEDFTITDVKDVGDTRYILAHNKDKTRGYLQKQCPDTCSLGCKKVVKGCCGEIAKGRNFIEFPVNACTSDSIFETQGPKGEPTCYPEIGLSGTTPVEIGNKLVGNAIYGYVCLPGGASTGNLNCYFVPGEGVPPGSGISGVQCDTNAGYLGQVKELVAIENGCYLTDTPRQGLDVNLDIFELEQLALENIGTGGINSTQDFLDYVNGLNETEEEIVQKTDVAGCIYCDYGDVAVIATDNGIFYDRQCACDQLPELTPYGNTCQNFSQISNIFQMDGQVGYINSRTGYAFFGGFGFNNGYFTAANTLYVGEDFDVAFNFGGILMLLSPERAGYIYRTGETLNGLPGVGFESLGEFGYLTPDSRDNYLDNGYLIGNDGELYSLGINYTGDNIFGGPRYRPQFTNISRYIRDYLKAIDICKGDKVNLHVDGQHIRIFIGNDSGRVINGEFVPNTGTIILNFERYEGHQFWHIWTVCNERICGEYKDCFYGDGIYHLEGCLDGGDLEPILEEGVGIVGYEEFGGQPFKQCVGMHVIDNPAGGQNVGGIFSSYGYKDLAIIFGDEHIKSKKIKVTEIDGTEEEFKGRTILRTRLTNCGKEEVDSIEVGDICFLCDLETQRYREDYTVEELSNNIGEATQETLVEDVYNINRTKEFRYCDIPELCFDEPLDCKIKTCMEEMECECEGISREFDNSKYWRYGRFGVATRGINKRGNHLYFEIVCSGGDRLHLVGMGVQTSDEVTGFGKCDCNQISKTNKVLHEVCKTTLHENTSARE